MVVLLLPLMKRKNFIWGILGVDKYAMRLNSPVGEEVEVDGK